MHQKPPPKRPGTPGDRDDAFNINNILMGFALADFDDLVKNEPKIAIEKAIAESDSAYLQLWDWCWDMLARRFGHVTG